MATIVGIRFMQAGKLYYFDAAGLDIHVKDFVVVETNRGHELGRVVAGPKEVAPVENAEPPNPVLRIATNEDISQAQQQKDHARKAMSKSKELIESLNLPMKAIYAQYNLDGSHLLVFFYAEKRVDFRELVRKLSHELRTHVELRQVGARDEAKLVGGVGKCGCQLCCVSFLNEFMPVSIKMAKEQDIALNPMKTSGLCGRLLCCLGYEYEQYHAMKGKLPDIGSEIVTKMGKAKIVGRNVIKETLVAQLETGVTVEIPVSEVVLVEKK
ncbi:MAG: regulatory iron-sulfur-containing complex subunit RicT [Chloroflexi bacterium]|nr:regulatory iron-sulfur-containing complex subunit RicT [Chloroflexota bacterium]